MPAQRNEKPGTAGAQKQNSSEKKENVSSTAGKISERSKADEQLARDADVAEGSRDEVDKSLEHDEPSENGNGQTLH